MFRLTEHLTNTLSLGEVAILLCVVAVCAIVGLRRALGRSGRGL